MADFENFQFLKFIGQGAFGEVNLYYDKSASKNVVIKRIDLNSEKVDLESVGKEIYILSKLDHPRIIRFLDVFQTMDTINIMMEYAPNGSLFEVIDSRRVTSSHFTENELMSLFCDLLMGVNYLHCRNIIHRDLKPENILLDWKCRVKIADFGVSKIYSGNRMNTNALTDGTPLYMAPELFQNHPYDYKSDVWSLGVIFYELCTLNLPFLGRDLNELYTVISKGIYKPIPWTQLNYNKNLQYICNMMIETDLVKRRCLNAIICHPLLTKPYYSLFFDI